MSLTAIVFVGVYVACLGYALMRRPMYGLVAYLWAFYNHPPSRWWGDDLPTLRWSLIAAVVTLLALKLHAREETADRPQTEGQ